jgi:hypothetical protein
MCLSFLIEDCDTYDPSFSQSFTIKPSTWSSKKFYLLVESANDTYIRSTIPTKGNNLTTRFSHITSREIKIMPRAYDIYKVIGFASSDAFEPLVFLFILELLS